LSSSTLTCEISPQTGELILDGVSLSIRPKSFELLLLLAENPQQIFSKQQILTSVWQDSVVEEQVIFQSINEIRKVAGHSHIIKTYPRRGYRWNVSNTVIKQTKQKNTTRPKFAYMAYISAILITLSVGYVVVLKHIKQTSTEHNQQTLNNTQHKGILVLPFNVSELSGAQQWLRFGAMQGLIDGIAPDLATTVFHLEDVIDILNRLPLNERGNINKIFAKSGASHILQTAISGQPGELNIIYNIYTPHSQHTQVLHASSINSALPELTREIEKIIGTQSNISLKGLNQQLQNQLIAKAIQFLETEDYESALAFVQSAVLNDSNNLMALYLLAKVNMQRNEPQQALDAIDQAFAMTQGKSVEQYQTRLYYFQAVAQLQLGQLKAGESNLLLAEELAKTNKDWLYYAYSQSILGKLRQGQKQFALADKRFNAALDYQELLHCPMGIAQAHLDLTELYVKMQNRPQALKSFNIANKLINDQQLLQAIPILEQTRQLL